MGSVFSVVFPQVSHARLARRVRLWDLGSAKPAGEDLMPCRSARQKLADSWARMSSVKMLGNSYCQPLIYFRTYNIAWLPCRQASACGQLLQSCPGPDLVLFPSLMPQIYPGARPGLFNQILPGFRGVPCNLVFRLLTIGFIRDPLVEHPRQTESN